MGWLRNLFFGSRAGSCEDWKRGDLAECIYDGVWCHAALGVPAPGPKLGERYVVVDVAPSVMPEKTGQLVLTFARFRPRRYAAGGFRKVMPRADEAVAGDVASLRDLLNTPIPSELESTDA